MLLIVAVAAGAFAVGLAFLRRPGAWLAVAVAAGALVGATARLVWAIWKLDFGFVYVAEQSRARSSGGYRVAALWGGAEGSLLFFAALMALVLVVVAARSSVGDVGVAAGAGVIAALAGTVAAFANPFEQAVLPVVRGAGLTPILEHPAMLYHPPILYLGAVATLAPFVMVMGRPHLDEAAIRLTRRWILVSWTLLTVGLATGANWAYVELGWGGYWAWDPVENTILMPWLVLTAAIHLLRSDALQSRFPRLVVTSALMPFVLVLFGAAVTRSGGLSSVHAFADARALGWSLGILAAVVAGLTAVRVMSARPDAEASALRMRDRFLLVSIVLAAFTTVFVMLGVGVPILPGSNRVVTAAFYNRIGAPVLALAVVGMAVMPVACRFRQRTYLALMAGAFVVGGSLAFWLGADSWLTVVVVAFGAVVVAGHLVGSGRLPLVAIVAHIGFVVLAFGIVGAAQSSVTTTVLAPGEVAEFGSDLRLHYDSFVVSDGPRLRSEAVTVTTRVTSAHGNQIVELTPGLVTYPDRAVVLAETAFHSTPRRDVQVVVRTITDDGLASFELSERPAQMLVWWGAALITVAGLIALTRPPRKLSRPVSDPARDNLL